MNRIASNETFNSRPRHEAATAWLLALAADLKRLAAFSQPLRADDSRLVEWAGFRAELERCEHPLLKYGQFGVSKELPDMPKHGEVLLLANAIVGELQLRNRGESAGYNIQPHDLQRLENLAKELDQCRERIRYD